MLPAEKDIELIKKILIKKFDKSIGKTFGSGKRGTTFEFGNDTVKITTDINEFNAASLLINKKLKNVYNVKKVFKLKSEKYPQLNNLMVIFYEKLYKPDKLSTYIRKLTDGMIVATTNYDLKEKNTLNLLKSLKINYDEVDSFFNSNKLDILLNKKNINLKPYLMYFKTTKLYDNFNNIITILKNNDIVYSEFKRRIYDLEIKTIIEYNTICAQLINGISELKSNNIIFSDASSKNVLYDKNGNLKWLDLGVLETKTGDEIGTLNYD